jgi:hypothetical protein
MDDPDLYSSRLSSYFPERARESSRFHFDFSLGKPFAVSPELTDVRSIPTLSSHFDSPPQRTLLSSSQSSEIPSKEVPHFDSSTYQMLCVLQTKTSLGRTQTQLGAKADNDTIEFSQFAEQVSDLLDG